jgi:hypothetical protein
LFVCFVFSRLSNFSAIRQLSLLPVTGLQIWAFEQGGIFIAPHLLRHGVPKWPLSLNSMHHSQNQCVKGSNSQLKDHQIFEPDALTTAPRGRLLGILEITNTYTCGF